MKKNRSLTIKGERKPNIFSKFIKLTKDKFYDLSVWASKLFQRKEKKVKTINSQKAKSMAFYIIMLAFPVAQFCVFYIGVNFNSILMSFQKFNVATGNYEFDWLVNIQKVIRELSTYTMTNAMKNSAIAFFVSVIVGVPLTLVFSYYIYKRYFFSGIFKIVLFMPSIVSSIAMVVMYKYFAENAIPNMFGLGEGLLGNSQTAFPTVLFYSVYMGFGSGVLLYSGAMGGISDSIVEAAEIDGASSAREFFKITLPLIYPTIVTFLITAIAAFFSNQVHLFSFFGENAAVQNYTLGYWLYNETQLASMGEYPFLAAMGLFMTVVVVPLTLVCKKLLEKFGPRTD
jgi:ABC-type sugar transport system permease subunit